MEKELGLKVMDERNIEGLWMFKKGSLGNNARELYSRVKVASAWKVTEDKMAVVVKQQKQLLWINERTLEIMLKVRGMLKEFVWKKKTSEELPK